MNRILIVLLCVFMSAGAVRASADSDIQVGGGLAYGTHIEELGLSAHGVFALNEKVSVAGDFRYFFAPEGISFTAFNANGQYVVLEGSSLEVFLLGGLNYATMSIDFDFGPFGSSSTSSGEIGLNIGGGIDLYVGEVVVRPEVKYVISEFDGLEIGACVLFGL